MGDPKPLASLSSSLLARKGQAKPAMRPQGFASFGFGASAPVVHEDLGWNDMGHDVADEPYVPQSAEIHSIAPVAPVITVEPSPAFRMQEDLERELAPIRAAAVRAAPGSKGKAAFTLRLDSERHLRLRLACAVAHKSAQQFVIAALDKYLDAHAGADTQLHTYSHGSGTDKSGELA